MSFSDIGVRPTHPSPSHCYCVTICAFAERRDAVPQVDVSARIVHGLLLQVWGLQFRVRGAWFGVALDYRVS